MQEEENPSEGLHPKDDADFSMSIADHIECGSYRNSRFISTSKNIDVCLFYASKAMYLRGAQAEDLSIAEISLDLDKGYVLDLSGSYVEANEQRIEVGIERRSMADNYAKIFQEVIVDRSIDANKIDSVDEVSSQLPNCCTFREFQDRLHRT
jgi:hypothetical protein